MDAYFKRYLWVLHICLIAAVAHSASQLASYFVIEAASEALKSKSGIQKPIKRSRLKHSRRTSQWADQIQGRNLFNANPPSPEELSSATSQETEEDKPKGQIPQPYDECEDSDLKVNVQVTMVAEPPSASYTMINVEGEDRIYRIGDTITEHEIVAIQWSGSGQRVVVVNEGKFECLSLGKKNASKKPKRYSRNNKRGKKKSSNSKANKFKDGIKEVSPGRYEVDRAMLDEQLTDLDNLVRQARVIPHYKRGKPAGFKVVGIRSNSIFRHLGLKSGDVLKSVGGEELTSINKALGLFEKLKTSDNLNLDLERRGKVSSFEYNIK